MEYPFKDFVAGTEEVAAEGLMGELSEEKDLYRTSYTS